MSIGSWGLPVLIDVIVAGGQQFLDNLELENKCGEPSSASPCP